MTQVTCILNAAEQGDPHAAGQLLPLVYEELRRLAAQRLAHEPAGQTLEATALVHEAYLRLIGPDPEQPWNSRGHFFAAAAEAMRRILIDRARAKATHKRGGQRGRLLLDEALPVAIDRADDLLALDEALIELEQHDEAAALFVKLRFFAGLTHQDAAEALGIGRRAADRIWALARAWLYNRLGQES